MKRDAVCLWQVYAVWGDASFQKDDSSKLEPSLWDTLMCTFSRWTSLPFTNFLLILQSLHAEGYFCCAVLASVMVKELKTCDRGDWLFPSIQPISRA